jgi:hypothetical protein
MRRLLPFALLALAGCADEEWPRDDDVYHTQIVIPEPDENGRLPHGFIYIDPQTGKQMPEVCDTYGSGQRVCRPASFDKAPTVEQERARAERHSEEWRREEARRAVQDEAAEILATIGMHPVYSWQNGRRSVEFMTRAETDAMFANLEKPVEWLDGWERETNGPLNLTSYHPPELPDCVDQWLFMRGDPPPAPPCPRS